MHPSNVKNCYLGSILQKIWSLQAKLGTEETPADQESINVYEQVNAWTKIVSYERNSR